MKGDAQERSVNRINRNIVECKVRYRFASPLTLPVLIETLWNVKVSSDITV